MLKGFNLQLSTIDPVSERFIATTGNHAMVLWSPQWINVEAVQGTIDMSLFTNTDAQVAWAHGLGLKVLLAIATESPTWAYAKRTAGLHKTGKLPPDDLGLHGPWAEWLKLVFDRYPNVTPIVLNEPNLVYYEDPDWGEHTAEMMMTAALVAHRAGHKHILGPACTSAAATERVLTHLNGWDPFIDVGCALHQYNDIQHGDTADVDGTLQALEKHKWKAGKRIWLTEGGLRFNTHSLVQPTVADPNTWAYDTPLQAQNDKQHHNVTRHFNHCKNMKPEQGVVECWTNYEVVDSLWGGWASGVFWHDGSPKRLESEWAGL